MSKVWSILMAGFAMSVCCFLSLESYKCKEKAKMNRYITIEKFIDILNEEEVREHHVMVLAVLADISAYQTGSN